MRPRPHYAHLPHETFAALAAFPDLWDFVLGSPDDFSSFWAGSASADSAVGQEWLAGIKAVWTAQHPDSAWADAVHRVCPLGMHGDEAGGHGHSKILVMTWGSVAVDRSTLDSRILFTMLKDSESAGRPTTDGTHNVLVWSLQALAAGVYPSKDEHGRAFGPEHHPDRAALAGQSLASARCGVFAEMRGDWEYLWKALRLRQFYGTDQCCHLCGAHKKDPARLYTACRRASALRTTHVSNAEWMASATSVLRRIPGFHVWRCFFDIMHTMDLGILQLIIPSALAELVARRDCGGLWDGANRQARVAAASADYRRWCERHHVPAQYRAKAITESWVKGDYPQVSMVHAKAAALRKMTQWISGICDTASAGQHGARRAILFRKLVQADRLLADNDRFLTPASADAYGSLVETALAVYLQLSLEARAAGIRLWPITPKFHAMQHIAYDQAWMGNPRRVHCYSDEDMVGKMKRIYIRCHGVTAPHRSLQRYALLQNMRWRRLASAAPPELGPEPLPDAPTASAEAVPAAPPLPDAPAASAALPALAALPAPPSSGRKRRYSMTRQATERAQMRARALRMTPRRRAKFLRTEAP